MNTSQVRFEDTGESGRYIYGSDASSSAEITFSWVDNNLLSIEHTEVPEVYRGQGIGLLMLEKAVSNARENGHKIVPKCSYAAAQFQRHPEWKDVLHEADQTR